MPLAPSSRDSRDRDSQRLTQEAVLAAGGSKRPTSSASVLSVSSKGTVLLLCFCPPIA